MTFWKRIKYAWRVLTSRVPINSETIYHVQCRPEHLVQIMYYEGYILGLDGQGRLWRIDFPYGNSGFPVFQYLSESPKRYV